jgi:hypothetical protein
MRLLSIIGIAIAAGLLATAVCGELVFDWHSPRSDFAEDHAFGVNVSMSLVSFNSMAKEMKEKYGERTDVSLEVNGGSGRARVERDGKVLHEEDMKQTFSDVIGLFMVGKRGRTTDIAFPFRLAPDQNLNQIDRTLAAAIGNRFGKAGLPQRFQTFTDQDWSIDRCVHLPDGLGLGGAGKLMKLRKGAACVVTWRRSQPKPTSMLVSVSLADGDPWMRPFSRRLCRAITEAALAQVDRGERDRPAFAGCVLVDRPGRKGAQESLMSHAYSVGPGQQLALMD